MKYLRQIPSYVDILKEFPLSQELQEKRLQKIKEIQDVLSGKDDRKILCIGPCSADREDAVLEYMHRLADVEKHVREKLLIIPRVYTSKPRTKGTGYKGMLHRPDANSGEDNLLSGIIATRKLHMQVIEETGFFCVDEMLYPETMFYFIDLLAYVAVGARSVEDQLHRLTASGLEIPVGMKNPTNGDLNVLLNSIEAAQCEQTLLHQGWEVQTDGNPYAHAILRGCVDVYNVSHPNYHYEDLCRLYDLYQKRNLQNMSVLVDCNHGNSNKQSFEQIRIAKEVLNLCKEFPTIDKFVRGFMVESYLEDGCQMPGGHVYGKSITDSCLGWDNTLKLFDALMR